MVYKQVVDVANNSCAAVSRMRIDAAFLTVSADVSGILRVHIFTDGISIVIEGIHGPDHIVCGFAGICVLLLGGSRNCSAGSCRVRICS